MKVMKISMAAAAACLLATSAHALKTEDRTLKSNMQVEYTKVPGDVDSLTEMFTKGDVYGRLRSNMFWFDTENENNSLTTPLQDHNVWGVGASMVFKTAYFNGFGATVGLYGSVPLNDDNVMDGSTVNYGKQGKDVYRTRKDGSETSMGNVAEGYLEYKGGKTDVKIGRQMIESTLLASNDTKMIPNTFEAAVVENKDIPDTKLRVGYITSEKLRNHQTFHSILAYKSLEENDDSGAHKGLSVANIAAVGEDKDPEMILITAENKSIKDLKLNADYYNIDGFFSTLVLEANYKIALGGDWSLTPGVRYLRQMDDGAGKIGGAATNGSMGLDKTNAAAATARASYSDPYSVDGSLWAARLVLANGPFSLMGGYSKIADDADIIAPWRGFPTGGYTRSMGQVDWIANTKNWMVQAQYDFNKAGLIPGLTISMDYADMNFDEKKMLAGASSYSDRTIFHVDAIQTFKALPNVEFKFRFATINADPVLKTTTVDKTDYASYNEYRFEMNYLF